MLHGTEIHRIWLHPRSTPQGAEAPGPPSQLSHYVARNRDPLKPPQEKGCLAWNWEAAENQGSSRAGRPSWDVGFLFPSLRFFRFHVGFFFNHIFGCWVTSVCHGFSSQMARSLVSASGKTYVGFLHSSSQGRDSDQLYYFFMPRHMSLSRQWSGLPGVVDPPIHGSAMVPGVGQGVCHTSLPGPSLRLLHRLCPERDKSDYGHQALSQAVHSAGAGWHWHGSAVTFSRIL